MAERKAVNKYYPPDWDPSKGSVNSYVGQHPLRDRAKKIGQGILVIRFELPYNIWCDGCNSHVGMGVRYNAEKKKVGNYYTTPIWKFRMKCHLCDNYFEIQTDPKNHDYVILNGARRKEQRWDPKENEQVVPEDKATQKKMATDAMYKLEHGSDDIQQGNSRKQNLGHLEDRLSQFKDDYLLNKLARGKFREEKKAIKKSEAADKDLLKRSSLEIPLIPESQDDIKLAGLLKYEVTGSYEEKQAQKRKAIADQSIFTSGGKNRETITTPSKTMKMESLKRKIASSVTPNKINMSLDKNTSKNTGLNPISLGIRRKSSSDSKKMLEAEETCKVMENGIPMQTSKSLTVSKSEKNCVSDTVTEKDCNSDTVTEKGCVSDTLTENGCDSDTETQKSTETKANICDQKPTLSIGLGLMATYSDSSSSDDNT